MQKITSVAGLKSAIQVLEVEQEIKGQLLREQVYLTYESLKPANLIRSTLKNLFSSQNLMKDISGSALGEAGGFLLKKLFVGTSANKLRKIIGAVMQYGLTNVISRNSEQIIKFGLTLFQHFFRKKEMTSRSHA
jgi:hypothetical protein